MKNKQIHTFFVMAVIIILLASSSVEKNTISEENGDKLRKENPVKLEPLAKNPVLGVSYIQHNSIIYINDNGDFLSQGFTGNGDVNDPYVFENRSISNSTGHLIRIQGTTAHFVIKNCSLNVLDKYYYGISLDNVVNGQIYNNTIYNSSYSGIDLGNYNENNTISNNTIYDCDSNGIGLYSFNNNNTILDNTIYNCSGYDGNGISLYASNKNNTISNNTIYNFSGYDGTGISLYEYNENNTVSNNSIDNFSGYDSSGIDLYDSNKNNTILDNTISNCSGTSSVGIGLYEYNEYNTILDNIIENCFDIGVMMYDSNKKNIVLRNTIENCSDDGFMLYEYNENNTISNNIINNCFDEGIYMYQYNKYNTFSNNTFNNCRNGFHFYQYDNFYNNISDNKINNCSNTGILLTRSINQFISRNTIYNCSGDGILIQNPSGYNIISYNSINKCSLNGIYLNLNSDNNTISNNTISNCNENGINLQTSSDYNIIFNNTINNCTLDGIHIESNCRYNDISNNTVSECSDHGIHLSSSSSYNSLSKNTIFNCDLQGIYLYNYCTNNTLTDNTIYNTSNGISQYESNNNTLTYNTIFNSTRGIHSIYSNDNVIIGNKIYDISNSGIRIWGSYNNILLGNVVYNCSDSGINLYDSCSFNDILGNTIYNCTNGIKLYDSCTHNTILGNRIYNCSIYGIEIDYGSGFNNISYNIVYNNTDYGLHISLVTGNCTIHWNNFMNNSFNGFNPQAFITGTNNNISYNYWNDWITPDSEPDGIVDNPYPIDGPDDPYPLTTQIPPFVITFSPITRNYISNTVTVILAGNAINYWYYISGIDSNNQTWTTSIDRTLSNGNYTLHSYGNNTLGVITHTSIIFSIGPLPPTVTIDSPTNITYLTSDILVNLSGNAVHYWYYIAGVDGVNQTWLSSDPRNLADGTYILYAYGNNTIDMTTQVSVTFTIAADTETPNVTIHDPFNTTYSQNSILLNYTVSDGTVTIYINDIANNSALPSELTQLNLQDGSYNLTITAVDQSGNINKTTVIFSVDTGPPTINLDSPINNTAHHSGMTIDVSVIDVHLDTVLYNWNETTNITRTGNFQTFLPTNEVQHILYVYANDSSGNWSSQVFVFTTDDTSPFINIISPINATYVQNSVLLNYTVSDGTVTIYINDAANSSALPSELTQLNLQDDNYNITIIAIDQAGNVGQDTIIFAIDTTPPAITIISPENNTYNDGMISIEFSGDAVYYWYYIVGIDSVNQTWTLISTRDLANGTYVLYLYGNDSVGNEACSNTTFTIDTTFIPHTLSELEILAPDTGLFTEEITIRWNPANDSYNHQITYNLYYSSDNGNTWEPIVSDISEMIYNWNIANIPNGSSYRIKIVAKCSEDSVEVISSIFTIENPSTGSTAPPTTTSVTPGWSFHLIVMIGVMLCVMKKRRR